MPTPRDTLNLRSLPASLAETLASAHVPTEADEIWRYSAIDAAALGPFGGIVHRRAVVVEPDGSGWTVASAAAAPLIPPDRDIFSALVATYAVPTVVDIADDAVVATPIRVTNDLDAAAGSVAVDRLVINAGARSQVTVLHQVRSGDVDGLFIPHVEIHVGESATVRYVMVQELGPRMHQIGTQSSSTARGATLSTLAVALGASTARWRTDAMMAGIGAHNEILAVYFGDQEQRLDFRTVQEHLAPRTTSDLVFKGAVEDRAASVYSGLIRIGPDARGARAAQTNRNLVLSPDASAESVPNLEIENNDVKCSHASAVGPIDDEQLYYLESRGVPTALATRLIVSGFFVDLLERVPDPDLRTHLVAAVTAKIDGRAA